jgi:sec-independent protein translocase protein TatA
MFLIGMPGGSELLIILLVVLLLFGGSKLPQLAKALGQSKKAFREGMDEADQETPKEVKEKS